MNIYHWITPDGFSYLVLSDSAENARAIALEQATAELRWGLHHHSVIEGEPTFVADANYCIVISPMWSNGRVSQ